MSTLYLLHFDPPYRHARHYLGLVKDGNVSRRLYEHLQGRGSPLVRAAYLSGCAVICVWECSGDVALERRLKNQANTPRWCPVCCERLRLAAVRAVAEASQQPAT